MTDGLGRSRWCTCCSKGRWKWICAAILVPLSLILEAVVRNRRWIRFAMWFGIYAFVSLRDLSHEPGDVQFEAFLDEFPITRFSLDVGQRAMFGKIRTGRVPQYMDRFDWLA